jgi:hypothetical protein
MATKHDIVIQQGKTFNQVVRWESTPIIYKPITGITQAAPVQITATAHGVPAGWRVAVVSVKGMLGINAKNTPPRPSDYHPATVAGANAITLNDVNSADYSPYSSGGYLQYNTPVDMTGFTARMTIKDVVGGTAQETLTSGNGKIVLDNTAKTITILLDAATTAAYTWVKGVYDLEMVSAAGVVTAILTGRVTVTKEVTT